jgi:hypothetical protein
VKNASMSMFPIGPNCSLRCVGLDILFCSCVLYSYAMGLVEVEYRGGGDEGHGCHVSKNNAGSPHIILETLAPQWTPREHLFFPPKIEAEGLDRESGPCDPSVNGQI